MARTKTVEIIAGTSFIWKGKLVRAGTKIKVPEEFYLREIALQKKRGAKLHKLANASETAHTPPFDDEYTYEDYLAGKVDDRGYKPPPSVPEVVEHEPIERGDSVEKPAVTTPALGATPTDSELERDV